MLSTTLAAGCPRRSLSLLAQASCPYVAERLRVCRCCLFFRVVLTCYELIIDLRLGFLAVFAAALKFAAVGAPASPGLRIFSPDPAAMRLRFAWMFAYSPCLAI